MDIAADSSNAASPSGGPPPSGCQYENFGRASVVTLKPELNDVKWDAIESIGNNVEKHLENHDPDKVVFDLTPLSYVGSAMVALVARWWKKVNANGGECSVAVADDNVLEVLKLAKLDTHWDIVPSREAAYKKLGITGAGSGGPSRRASRDDADGNPLWPLIVAGVGAVLVLLAGANRMIVDGSFSVTNILLIVGGLVMAIGGALGLKKCWGGNKTASLILMLLGILMAAIGGLLLLTPNRAGAAIDDAGEAIEGELDEAEQQLQIEADQDAADEAAELEAEQRAAAAVPNPYANGQTGGGTVPAAERRADRLNDAAVVGDEATGDAVINEIPPQN